jgi:MurNAc alpha-1-phosphate uridylyltransferase
LITKLVLLAGGKATRLRPVTETIPKSLLEVAGKPFIDHQLELIKRNNITQVVICVSYLGGQVREFVGDGSRYGLKIDYSFDGDTLLGTGGTIKNALDLLDDKFFVMYGDSYLTADFKIISDYFLKGDKSGLMTVFKNEGKWDKSNIDFRDGKIINYDKSIENKNMEYIDYGLGILTKRAFEDFKNENVFDLEAVYKNLLRKEELLGYEVSERFYEIGSFRGLEETKAFLENKMV